MSLGFFDAPGCANKFLLCSVRRKSFCGDLHTLCLMCGEGCSGMSLVSLAESLLGWIIYSPVFKQRSFLFTLSLGGVFSLSFAVCFEFVRFCIFLDPGSTLLIPSALFFPSNRSVYSCSQSSAVNTCFLNSLDRAYCLLTPAVGSSSSVSLYKEVFSVSFCTLDSLLLVPETGTLLHPWERQHWWDTFKIACSIPRFLLSSELSSSSWERFFSASTLI